MTNPSADWPEVWRRVRLSHIASETKSLVWRLLHDLLLTEQRLSRLNPELSSACRYCSDVTTSDLEHCLFTCCKTSDMGSWLLAAVRLVDPLATPPSILRLEVEGGEALVWVICACLHLIWSSRASG